MKGWARWGAGCALAMVLGVVPAPAQRRLPARPGAVAVPRVILAGLIPSGSLTLTPGELDFPASNPTTQPIVPAVTPLRAYVTIATPLGALVTWSLAVRAQGGTLTSGSGTIPVGAISWRSAAGVLSGNGTARAHPAWANLTTRNVRAARGREGTGRPFQALVTCSFRFTDSWNYAPGTYQQSVLFTLAAP